MSPQMMVHALNITDEKDAAGVCVQVLIYARALPFFSYVVQASFSSPIKWGDWADEHFEL